MNQPALNPNMVNTSIFGMASAVFTSACAMVVTTAVRGNTLVDKLANTLIHGVAAAENVAEAVERRSKIYGDGIVRNGELAERETTLKYKLRLVNLERNEAAIQAGTAEYVPEPSLTEKFTGMFAAAKSTVSGEQGEEQGNTPLIRSAVVRA